MAKDLKIILLVLIVVLLGVYVFHFFSQSKPSAPPSLLTDAERMELLKKGSDIPPINPTMTDKERQKLMNQPSKIPPL